MNDAFRVLVLPGDGIGPEVTAQAVLALEGACRRGGMTLSVKDAPFGGAAIDSCGVPLPEATLARAREAHAVLLGAVGGPEWDSLPTDRRPERGLLQLRSGLDAFANLRPARLVRPLAAASPLGEPLKAAGFDFVVVRELCGDVYFGAPRGVDGHPGTRRGFNTMVYTEEEISRIGKVAFETARGRRKRLLSVDKANVLEVMALWREVMDGLARDYPDVELSHMYVDNCAMQLVLDPKRFDVIVTGNMFGDILSDLAGALTGSLGMLPSASLGPGPGIFEPVHGSAPDIAGTDRANPLAAILSAALLLDHAARRPDLAALVRGAVDAVLDKGLRTADIRGAGGGVREVGTREMGAAVLSEIERA